MEEKRNNMTIQIMRSLAIVLVLIHHSIVNVNASIIGLNIDSIIICFHMPVFFVISGLLFEMNLNKYLNAGKIKFVKKKMKHLVLPYLFWTIILWFFVQIACFINKSFMIKMGFSPMSVFQLIKGIFTYEIYYTQHLWFLYVLFLMFLLNIIFSKMNKKIIFLMSILFGFSTVVIQYPNIIVRFLLWLQFFEFGRCLYSEKCNYFDKMSDSFSRRRVLNIGVVLLFILLCYLRISFLNDGNDLLYMKFLNRFNAYLIGFLGFYLLSFISYFIGMCKFRSWFSIIGDYSYEIYLMHNPYFVALLSIILSSIIKIPSFISVIIAVSVGILLPILICKFIYKYCKKISIVMFGK